jgi:hypothetical protein
VFREPLSMTAPSFPCGPLPLRPSGVARVDAGILEVLAGDGLRVPVREIVAIELAPALGRRLLLVVVHRMGPQLVQRRFWVEPGEHEALARLARAVRAGAACGAA